MTDELKPVRCGCGGEALPCYCDCFGTKYWSVTCQECLTHTDRFDTEAEAVEAWNRAMGTEFRTLLQVLVHDAEEHTPKAKTKG